MIKATILILITMLFLHIVFENNVHRNLLQVEKDENDSCKYNNKEWIFKRSFQWAFIIQIPVVIYMLYVGQFYWGQIIWFIWNVVYCYCLDRLEHSSKWADQHSKFFQVVITWFICVMPVIIK